MSDNKIISQGAALQSQLPFKCGVCGAVASVVERYPCLFCSSANYTEEKGTIWRGGAVAACRTNDVNDIYNKMRERHPLTCDLFLISNTCRLLLGTGTTTWRVSERLSHPRNVEGGAQKRCQTLLYRLRPISHFSVKSCTLTQLANKKGAEVIIDLFMLPKASVNSWIIQSRNSVSCL